MTENNTFEKQREEIIKKLEWNYAHGHLTMEELERRLEIAVKTTLPLDLENISADLKNIDDEPPSTPGKKTASENVPEEESITGFLSGISRKGKWNPARNTRVIVFMGGVELDFTDADLPSGEFDLEFFCVMGGIEMTIPEGINVEVKGIPFMGGIENRLSGSYNPDNPTIRIHGILIMGGLEIKPPKKRRFRHPGSK